MVVSGFSEDCASDLYMVARFYRNHAKNELKKVQERISAGYDYLAEEYSFYPDMIEKTKQADLRDVEMWEERIFNVESALSRYEVERDQLFDQVLRNASAV